MPSSESLVRRGDGVRRRRPRFVMGGAVVVTLAAAVWFLVGHHAARGELAATGDPSPTSSTRSVASSSSTLLAPSVHYRSMPPVIDPANIYSETTKLQPALAGDLARVYVPSGLADRVTVIDPTTKKVVGTFNPGSNPQHVVPSYDLRTLWILNNKGDTVVPIDARSGRVGPSISVGDPYNMYFSPDGQSAIVVAELYQRLDFRDPQTMALQSSLTVEGCAGINHGDYDVTGRYFVVTCEYVGMIAEIDMTTHRVVKVLALPTPRGHTTATMVMPDGSMASAMPQDIRLGPDGRRFYVADMLNGGLHVIDASSLTETAFIETGIGTHGITPSRDGTKLYVANRGTTALSGSPHGPGSVSVVDLERGVVATWAIPGGGSPDMGNLTADGRELWLSGRFDSEVYVFDTTAGRLIARIHVPRGPHGLTVWPQPGRVSLGHTGNMR